MAMRQSGLLALISVVSRSSTTPLSQPGNADHKPSFKSHSSSGFDASPVFMWSTTSPSGANSTWAYEAVSRGMSLHRVQASGELKNGWSTGASKTPASVQTTYTGAASSVSCTAIPAHRRRFCCPSRYHVSRTSSERMFIATIPKPQAA